TPAGVAAAEDVLACRPQRPHPGRGALLTIRAENGNDPAVHAVRHRERLGRQGELLNATTEQPGDQLTSRLEDWVPLGPDLHPPQGGLLVEAANLRSYGGRPELRTVELRHAGQ